MNQKIIDFFNSEKRILVVDDIKSARKVIGKLLEKIGVKDCDYAENGKEALSIIGQGKTYLVISDWNMPVMNGIELFKSLDPEKFGRVIPFIMITSSSEKDSVISALKEGVSEYIVKPFNEMVIQDKVAKMVERNYFKA